MEDAPCRHQVEGVSLSRLGRISPSQSSVGVEPGPQEPEVCNKRKRSPSGLRHREGTKRVITSQNLTSLRALALREAGRG